MTSTAARPGERRPPLPSRGRGSLLRSRVLQLLDAAREVPVVSVEAPGGFGKTTVLRQWADLDPRPVVWITVRPQAPDAAWLAHELLHGLHEAGLCPAVSLPPALDPVAWHLGVLPLVEQTVARASGPFLVVVDEAGALEGPRWDCLAASVAQSLPEGSQLLLAGRTQAPPSLRRLLASGGLATVGPDVLALDAVEGDQILRSLGLDLNQAVVLRLLEQTGGWPIALPLVASALRAGRRRQGDAELVSTEALADYLRHEVLERLAAEDARLLLRCSVLPELDGPACDALTASSGSLARLRRLSASTHLLAATDPAANSFRLHPLLASFLSEELRAGEPASWRDAHTAAAAVAERRGDLDSAVFHLRAVEDDASLGRLVWRHVARLLCRGRDAVLARWLHGLPEGRVTRVPELALTAAWLASREGDIARMDRLVMAAHTAAARSDPDFLLEVGLLEATIGADGLQGIVELCQSYLERRRGSEWLTLAYLLSGIAHGLLGDAGQARLALEQGHRLTLAHDLPLMTAHCLAALADLAMLGGDQELGVALAHQARAIHRREHFDFIATTAPIVTTSAYALLLQGRLAGAQADAELALRLTALMRPVAPWHAVQGRVALAKVYLGLGDGARAAELADEARAALGPATRSPVLAEMVAQVAARTAAVRSAGPPGSALTTAEVRVLQYLPTHLSFPEIAAELFVSRHTVKTQALSAYRKLGVHSRSEAIEAARVRGLLPAR